MNLLWPQYVCLFLLKCGNMFLNATFFSLAAALAMGLCVAMIAFVRLPSLKVSCLLLSGLLIYDVFWVRSHPTMSSTCITKRKHSHKRCRLQGVFRKWERFGFMKAFACLCGGTCYCSEGNVICECSHPQFKEWLVSTQGTIANYGSYKHSWR